MPVQTPHGTLYVEGPDDEHAIKQLLARHGINIHDVECPLKVHCARSDSAVIDAISIAVKASGKHPVGFVVDTDAFEAPSSRLPQGRRLTRTDRWNAIRTKLASVGVPLASPPEPVDIELPSSGFISRSITFDRNVGIWLMPDNRVDCGRIEDLLKTLVPSDDALFDLAKRATTEAIAISSLASGRYGAIQPKDESKGQLRSWLAWQSEPGMSYSVAFRKKCFNHQSAVANLFVAWFCSLFSIQDV